MCCRDPTFWGALLWVPCLPPSRISSAVKRERRGSRGGPGEHRGRALVLLNGTILGVHARPKRLLSTLRQLRRAGYIGEFVSVHRQADAISIACDGGRVCRPLIICDRGVPRLTQHHIAQVPAPSPPLTFTQLFCVRLWGAYSSALLGWRMRVRVCL